MHSMVTWELPLKSGRLTRVSIISTLNSPLGWLVNAIREKKETIM